MLTPKQQLFVKHYQIEHNATKAAVAAGYSEKTAESAGSRLLRNVKIQAEVNKFSTKLHEKLDITAEYILNGIRDTIQRALAKENFHAVLKGFELLGRNKKLFVDKVEHSGEVGTKLILIGPKGAK